MKRTTVECMERKNSTLTVIEGCGKEEFKSSATGTEKEEEDSETFSHLQKLIFFVFPCEFRLQDAA